LLFLFLVWEVLLPVVFGQLQNNYRIEALEAFDTIYIRWAKRHRLGRELCPFISTASRSVDT